MNKTVLLASILSGCAALTANAVVTNTPGDRIDVYTDASTFSSVLVDNIRSITYDGDPANGYTHVVISTYDNRTMRMNISDFSQLMYMQVNETPYEIKSVDTDHAVFRMLYNHNKPDEPNPIDPTKPYGWRGAKAGDPVFFLPSPDKGWTCGYYITGQFTGTEYMRVSGFVNNVSAEASQRYGIGIDCLGFPMPFEPVTLTMYADEITDYENLPILGTYYGTLLHADGMTLNTGKSDATIELKANTTFDIKTGDSDPINLVDRYTYSPETSTIEYIPDPEDANKNPIDLKVKWGISGSITPDGNLYVYAKYIPRPVMENNRHYAFCTEPCTYAIANVDEYGFRTLVELKSAKGASYSFFENYGSIRHDATAEFVRGTSLSETSTAYISYDGERQLKYTHEDGHNPVIKIRSSEAGTYSYTGSGNHTSLVLDGFDTATVDGTEYTYTVTNGIVSITTASGTWEVVIDKNNLTYAEKPTAEWDGSKTFTSSNVKGAYRGGSEAANCTVTVMLDRNPNGSTNEGIASIIVKIPTGTGSTVEANANSGAYIYNDSDNTITITNVASYVLENGSYIYGRRNITLHVNDDKGSLYIGTEVLGDRLNSNSKDGSYILLGKENATLQASEN